MHCKICDVILQEYELRQIDPRTNQQRGCNRCWSSIQDTLDDYSMIVSDEDKGTSLETVSLEEVEYEPEPTYKDLYGDN